MAKDFEKEYMKKCSIHLILEQLRIRGESVILANKLDRYDLLIKRKDKIRDIKLKVKFSKPIKRSMIRESRWEFIKLMHRSRLWPNNVFDFYILVGFGDNGNIKKIWKISVDDNIIYRKNQIYIPVDRSEDYNDYELKILEPPSEMIRWID